MGTAVLCAFVQLTACSNAVCRLLVFVICIVLGDEAGDRGSYPSDNSRPALSSSPLADVVFCAASSKSLNRKTGDKRCCRNILFLKCISTFNH